MAPNLAPSAKILLLKAVFLAICWAIKLALEAPKGLPDFGHTAQLVNCVAWRAVFEIQQVG